METCLTLVYDLSAAHLLEPFVREEWFDHVSLFILSP